MNLTQILVFAAMVALLYPKGPNGKPSRGLACTWDRIRIRVVQGRGWVILVASTLALYWLQSSSPIRSLDFWLPTASLALTTLVWVVIYTPDRAAWRTAVPTIAVIIGVVALIASTRYFDPLCCITATRPPDIFTVTVGILIVAVISAGAAILFRGRARRLNWIVLGLIVLFVVLKLDIATQAFSAILRGLNGQDTAQAAVSDVRWLGFSYIAFRLIAALRDRVTARPAAPGKPVPTGLSLREFISYVIFFPALTAGPIDRADRWIKDYRNFVQTHQPAPATTPRPFGMDDVVAGAGRILLGVFKKFVIADMLAIIALNSINAAQVTAPGVHGSASFWGLGDGGLNQAIWTWVLVYAYAWRILFDFSGYTDIAIGLGRMFGIKLPENFDRPYFKPNLTLFWNSWHMSLSQWFRAYYFNPITRALRSAKETPFLPEQGFFRQSTFIILFGQVTTMLLIGLWHGITWNFIAWSVWHAVGLFAHNRWTDYQRRRNASDDLESTEQNELPLRRRLATTLSVLATFHFVALGWIWFALPSVSLSIQVFGRLVGIGG